MQAPRRSHQLRQAVLDPHHPRQETLASGARNAAPPRPAPRDRCRHARGLAPPRLPARPRRRDRGCSAGGGRVPGRVRAGASDVRVALRRRRGGEGAAAARSGEREPTEDGPGHRQHSPGAARRRLRRRRVAASVRVAERDPHGGQVPAPGLLRCHQLRPRREHGRARSSSSPAVAGAWLVTSSHLDVCCCSLVVVCVTCLCDPGSEK